MYSLDGHLTEPREMEERTVTPIIVITNTFPFEGEQFLRTELELVDKDIPITLWTFLHPKQECDPLLHRETIKMLVFCKKKLKKNSKIKAAVSSVTNLSRYKEVEAVIGKRGKLRNLIKAVKFGYISELRVIQIADWVRKTYGNDPEVIFYSYWMYEAAYVSARLKITFPKCKFVTRCHRFDLYESQHANGYLPYRHFILNNADIVFPISDDARNYLNKLYNNKYDHKLEVARIGSICDFGAVEAEKSEKCIIVSCSNLIPVKRVNLIAAALKNIDFEIEWYHFGDGETRNEVETITKKFPDNVHAHLMGFTPNHDIQKFYSSHDITALINVSSSEGVPVSIMEAQSYGIPVIATDVGGTSEIVIDQVNGILLNEDFEADALISAIKSTIAQKEVFCKNALKTWSEKSNQRSLVKNFYLRLTKLGEQ